MTKQEPTGSTNNDVHHNATFVNCNGLRYAIPYESTTAPIFIKEKYVGQPLDQILGSMFRLERGKQPLDEASAFWRCEIAAGRVEIRLPKKSRDDPWEWKIPSSSDPNSPGNNSIVIQEKSTCVRLRQHVHEKVVPTISVEILSENERWLAINKPGGIATIDEVGGTGVNSLMTMVHEKLTSRSSEDNPPNIKNINPAHRLDKPVSGVLLLGKSSTQATKLLREIQRAGNSSDGQVKKVYIARVRRNVESVALVKAKELDVSAVFPSDILVEAELKWVSRDKRSVVISEEAAASQAQARKVSQAGAKKRQARKNLKRASVHGKRKRPPGADGASDDSHLGSCSTNEKADEHQPMKTHTTRFRRLGEMQEDGSAFVECLPLTGQRHQIRAHLASIGWPIANDFVYHGGHHDDNNDNVEGTTTKERLWAYADDETGTLQRVLGAPEVRRSWCNKCKWTTKMLGCRGLIDGGEENKDTSSGTENEEDGEKGRERVQPIEVPCGGIWLHALRYVLPSIELDVVAPLPEWALPAKTWVAHHFSGKKQPNKQ